MFVNVGIAFPVPNCFPATTVFLSLPRYLYERSIFYRDAYLPVQFLVYITKTGCQRRIIIERTRRPGRSSFRPVLLLSGIMEQTKLKRRAITVLLRLFLRHKRRRVVSFFLLPLVSYLFVVFFTPRTIVALAHSSHSSLRFPIHSGRVSNRCYFRKATGSNDTRCTLLDFHRD